MNQPKQVVYTPVDISDAEYTDQITPPTEEEIEFEKFREEMKDSADYAKITISEQPTDSQGRPMGRKLMQMFECGLDDYTFSQLVARIRDDYGTGIYKIQARNADGTFRYSQKIGVRAPNKPDSEKSGNDATGVIETVSDALERQRLTLAQMMNQQPQIDPIDQMTKMMTAMGGMMAAMGLGQQNQPPPKTPLENMMEMKMMKEIAGELFSPGEAGGESGFWGAMGNIAQGLGGPLMAAIAAGQQSGAVSPDGVIQLPGPVAEEPPQTEPEKDTSAENQTMQLESMKTQLSFLANQAKNGVPVSEAISFVMNALPEDDEILDSLESFLQRPDCIDQCILVVPEVGEHRPWFSEWIRGMLFELDKMVGEIETLTLEGELDQNAGSDAGGIGDPDKNAATKPPDDSVNPDGNPKRNGGN